MGYLKELRVDEFGGFCPECEKRGEKTPLDESNQAHIINESGTYIYKICNTCRKKLSEASKKKTKKNNARLENGKWVKICSNSNCKHNGIPQPVENFNKDVSTRDGLCCRCKTCIAESNNGRRPSRKKREDNDFKIDFLLEQINQILNNQNIMLDKITNLEKMWKE